MASNRIIDSPSPSREDSSKKIDLVKIRRLLTSQYAKIIDAFPKPAERQEPKTFPQFAKLPEELQLKIWHFAALLPRVFKLGMAPKSKRFRKVTSYWSWNIINYSGVHPLLITTFTSRQIALQTLGDGYSVDFTAQGEDRTIRTCYTIRYNPLNDTIFVSNLLSLDTLSRCYHISPKACL